MFGRISDEVEIISRRLQRTCSTPELIVIARAAISPLVHDIRKRNRFSSITTVISNISRSRPTCIWRRRRLSSSYIASYSSVFRIWSTCMWGRKCDRISNDAVQRRTDLLSASSIVCKWNYSIITLLDSLMMYQKTRSFGPAASLKVVYGHRSTWDVLEVDLPPPVWIHQILRDTRFPLIDA